MKIYIKSFKSISDGQYVALGKKLTFLVGPNSAGKSVVAHALEHLKGNDPCFDPDARLQYYNPIGDRVAAVQSLGLEWQDGDDLIEYRSTIVDGAHFGDYLSHVAEIHNDQLVCKEYEQDNVRFGNPRRVITRIISNVVVSASVFDAKDSGVTRYKRGDNFRTNLHTSHPGYVDWNVEAIHVSSLGKDRKKLEAAYRWLLELWSEAARDEDWAADIAGFEALWGEGYFHWQPEFIFQLIRGRFDGAKRQGWLNQFGHHDAAIKKVLDEIDGRFRMGFPGGQFDVALVSANRVLPTDAEVNGCVSTLRLPENPYQDLMRSFLANEWGLDWYGGCDDRADRSFEKKEGRIVSYWPAEKRWSVIVTASEAGVLAVAVNKALAEDLFIDNGYQIGVSSTLRVKRKDLVNVTHVEVYRKGGQTWFPHDEFLFDAQLHLRDAHGRQLNFSEVGSGIGYVLPVLIECFRQRNTRKVVFIQQPELHLHPALQAALCDVLINAAKDRMIVSETHSEHLILRALKRIRQTFNGTLVDEELRLHPEDVAVNYFEPQADGSTKVYVLRIAPDGDFIDRWPDGFFPERDRELFDE